ncbi:MAG: flippase activity-associated protein Agl23 [Halobacteriales archaeon]
MARRLGQTAAGRLWRQRRLRGRSPLAWLALVAIAALALRLAWLGRRAVHFDEARVGVEVLRYLHTGEFLYFPALHGPVLFHVDRALFAWFGPSDLVLRLPVAVVGGLLPLAAWLFRDHLDDREVVALGVVMAANPLLLYYSRFARSDLLVAAFMVVTLGCGLRLRATGRARYLYAGTAALALGLASKENALLYLLSWAGAASVLAAARLTRRPAFEMSAIGDRLRNDRRWLAHGGIAGVQLVALVTVLYAPRGGERPRLGQLLAFPDGLAVVEAATVGSARRLLAIWVYGGGHPVDVYLWYLGQLLALLVVTSLPLLFFATVGLLADWRRRGNGGDSRIPSWLRRLRRALRRPRPLVAFSLLWAASAVVGYPFASDLVAAWTAVHVVVPLAVPAAIGLAATWRAARGADARRRRRLAGSGLLVAAAVVGSVGGWSSYAAPGAPYNPFGQPGQPEADFRKTMVTVERVAATNAGPDVVYVGDFYAERIWQLPFEWYLAPAGVTSTTRSLPLEDPPPVVVALDVHAETLGRHLAGYRCVEHDPYPWGGFKPGGRQTETVVFVEEGTPTSRGSRWRPATHCGPETAGDRPVARRLEQLG